LVAVLRRTHEYGQQADLLGYAAPEQLEPTGIADGRSDVFTIGVFLWEMLANRRLFAGNQASEVIEKVLTMPVPLLDSIPRAGADPVSDVVSDVVRRALERDPRDRYAGTTALLQALEIHAGLIMAAPKDVGEYISGLVGSVFEARARTIERALGPQDDDSARANAPVLRKAVSSPVAASDPRPRAATTKKSQKSSPKIAPIPPPPPKATRSTPTPRHPASSDAAAPPALVPPAPPTSSPIGTAPRMASNPPVIAALVDDAIAHETREERKRQSSSNIHPTPPPVAPLRAVMPSLPSVFELPGAELFATPGLPPTKPASIEPHAAPSLNAPIPAEPQAQSAAPQTVQEAAAVLPPEAEPSRSIATPASLRGKARVLAATAQRPRMWIAIFSVVLAAFTIGIGVRRCAKAPELEVPTEVTIMAAADRIDQGSLADAAISASLAPVASSVALDAGLLPDASVPEPVADAGVAPKPIIRKPQPAARAKKRNPAPRYNAKTTRSRGKTAR
jgi:hypothetical protein